MPNVGEISYKTNVNDCRHLNILYL